MVVRTRELIIENFQCHKNTKIKLPKNGLAVLTGESRNGKSAIVRAWKWLAYNRPQGDAFIRHGAAECKVRAVIESEEEDGLTVQVMRRRTASLNQYIIDDGSGDEKIFEGFGNEVPLEVQQLLGVYPYDVGEMTVWLNLAPQLDGPFLGSSAISGPQRAKILGKMAGAEVIDRAAKGTETDLYREKQKKKRLADEVVDLNGKIRAYDWVEPMGRKIKKLKRIREDIAGWQERFKVLKSMAEELREIQEAQRIWQDILNMNYIKNLPLIQQGLLHIEGILPRFSDYKRLNHNLNNNWQKQNKIEIMLDQDWIKKASIALAWVRRTEEKIKESRGLKFRRQQLNDNKNFIRSKQKIIEKSGQPEQAVNILLKVDADIRTVQRWRKSLDSINDIKILKQDVINRINLLGYPKKALQILLIAEDSITRENNILNLINRKIKNRKSRKNIINKTRTASQKYSLAVQQYNYVVQELGICPTCGAEARNFKTERVV